MIDVELYVREIVSVRCNRRYHISSDIDTTLVVWFELYIYLVYTVR